MLKRLIIKNFTLIDQLDMPFHEGFSVITGETGAGKSIVLGAIGLLLGQRADSKQIKQGKEKCVVEAHFDLSKYSMEGFFNENDIEYDAGDCIIRREVMASGKSRAFINDTPVQLSMLKELGETLVDIHSQHQNLLLNKHDFQLNVVDIIAGDETQLDDYRAAFADYQEKERQVAELEEEIKRNQLQADFIRFQHDELEGAQLAAGEQEELERQGQLLSHSEEIKSALYEASNALSGETSGALENVRTACNALRHIASVYDKASETAERLDSCLIELKDIASELETQVERIDFDPQELERTEQRLDLIYTLLKKYDCADDAQLLQRLDQLKQQLDNIDNSDDRLAELRALAAESKARCEKLAATLHKLREKSARKIEQEMKQRLVPLGMPNVQFSVSMSETTPNRNGTDQVAFLFSANTSTPLRPVAQVASGGETARVMLALKAMISGAVKLPTIIFDEIDTGVSGKMGEQMGTIMRQMGDGGRQVISITHLPQIAALGAHHYKVYKEETADGTSSRMELLSDESRIAEIAQMLSGSDISEAAIGNAKALLGMK